MIVESYKLKDLAEMEGKAPATIKNWKIFSKNYIAIKFENWLAKQHYKAWTQKTPYSIRYIKFKDIKEYIEKKTWKKLVLIDKKDL